MQVLNATKGSNKRMISIMLDRGEQIQIAPGEVSGVFTPSINSIKAAINSGTPEEIGVVLGGSWEESIGRQITGGHPYYYTSLEEAKAKLFNDNAGSESDQGKGSEVYTDNSGVIANLQERIGELEGQVENYKAAESNWKMDAMKLEKAEASIKDYEVKVKELTAENEGLKSDLTTKTSQVQELEAYKNKSIEDTKVLNDQLEQANTKIENMRTTFNQVCDQFNIQFDENKGWFIPGTDESEQPASEQ